MVNIKYKKIFLNPSNVKRKAGILKNIISITQVGDEVIVEFEEEPTQGEKQAILAFINQNRWEIVEE